MESNASGEKPPFEAMPGRQDQHQWKQRLENHCRIVSNPEHLQLRTSPEVRRISNPHSQRSVKLLAISPHRARPFPQTSDEIHKREVDEEAAHRTAWHSLV